MHEMCTFAEPVDDSRRANGRTTSAAWREFTGRISFERTWWWDSRNSSGGGQRSGSAKEAVPALQERYG